MSQVTLEEARTSARDGRYREAADLFDAYLAGRDGPEPGVLLERGFALLLAGDGEGARRVHQALRSLLSKLAEIPAEMERLWVRFCELIERVPRRVVAASVAAALVSGCGTKSSTPAKANAPVSASQPATQAAPLVPQTTNTFSDPLGGPVSSDQPGFSSHRYSGGVALPIEPAQPIQSPPINLDDPGFSSHRYSGGVALPVLPQLQGDEDLEQLLNEPSSSGHSAHRYSGGVRLPIRKEE